MLPVPNIIAPMRRRIALFAFAIVPFIVASAQQTAAKQEPMCEQVFKNIQVFKGVPASDLIPSMEFMAASLKYECSDCHDAKDFSVETRAKDTARHMILMQRDINAKNFSNRTQVTCMTCHRGSEHPVPTPMPGDVSLRHARMENAPSTDDLFAKHIAAAGKPASGFVVRAGTMTAPNDATHKVETKPLEFIQGAGGKFRLVAGERKVGSDGAQVWYGTYPMTDEPAAMFGRIGRSWRGGDTFAGLERASVAGKDMIGKSPVIVVRASSPSTTSTQELYFDAKTGLLLRMVNARRASLGTVVTSYDYSNFKTLNGMAVPMKVVMTFAGGEQWIMDFKTAKIDPSINESVFKMGGAG
jgi:photosynthetic reaction center cytochrome c subunit